MQYLKYGPEEVLVQASAAVNKEAAQDPVVMLLKDVMCVQETALQFVQQVVDVVQILVTNTASVDFVPLFVIAAAAVLVPGSLESAAADIRNNIHVVSILAVAMVAALCVGVAVVLLTDHLIFALLALSVMHS